MHDANYARRPFQPGEVKKEEPILLPGGATPPRAVHPSAHSSSSDGGVSQGRDRSGRQGDHDGDRRSGGDRGGARRARHRRSRSASVPQTGSDCSRLSDYGCRHKPGASLQLGAGVGVTSTRRSTSAATRAHHSSPLLITPHRSSSLRVPISLRARRVRAVSFLSVDSTHLSSAALLDGRDIDVPGRRLSSPVVVPGCRPAVVCSAARAPCVVGRPQAYHSFVVGLDGSANSEIALSACLCLMGPKASDMSCF